MSKLFIYTRVSTQQQVIDSDSLDGQAKTGIELAKKNGLEYEVFEEAGKSASTDLLSDRPVIMQVLDEVRKGKCKNVFVTDLTRLSRNEYTQALICKDLKKHNVKLYTAQGFFDFSSPQNSLIFNIMSNIALFDGELRKQRFKQGYNTEQSKGRYLNPIPPYGWRKDEQSYLIVDEEEKVILLKVIEMYESGMGTNRIAAWLNENKILTKLAKLQPDGFTLKAGESNRRRAVSKLSELWNAGTLLSMLKNTILYGERRYTIGQDEDGKDIYATVACPPIISKERWERLQEKRKKNAISGKKEVKYFTLLKGLISCAHCGNNMHSVIKIKKKQITYKCISKRVAGSSCNESRAINIPKLDSLVWQVYLNSFYYNDEIFRTMSAQSKDTKTLQDEIDIREQELNTLNNDLEHLNQKKVNLITKLIDPRFSTNQIQIEEVMESLNKDSEVLNKRVDALVHNIKSLKKQLQDSNDYIDMYAEGLKEWNKIIEEFSHIQPPFATKYEQVKARAVINRAVKNVSVEFLKESNEHRIKIEFNSVDVTHHRPVGYDSRKGKYLEAIDGEDEFGGYKVIHETWNFNDVVELIPVTSRNPIGISMIMPILLVHGQGRIVNLEIPPLGTVPHRLQYDEENGRVLSELTQYWPPSVQRPNVF